MSIEKKAYPQTAKEARSLQSKSSPMFAGREADTSSQLLSPDIDKFLLDVNSALQAQPPSPPPPPPPTSVPNFDQTTSDNNQCRGHKPRPTVAAKFTGETQISSLGATDPSDICNGVTGAGIAIKTPSIEGDGVHRRGSVQEQSSPDGRHPLQTASPSTEIALASGPQGSSPEGIGADPGEVRADAASKIQQWYRRQRDERMNREVQSLLQEKKDELNRSRMEEEGRARNEVAT